MGSLVFDTTFLIDFQREQQGGGGTTHAFLEEHEEDYAYLPIIACGEFGEEFKTAGDALYRSIIDSFELLPVTEKTAEHYSRITRMMRKKGRLIGANDLWIAATAVEKEFPLVTRNVEHFSRVPELRVIGY
jgi:predicted nucleic acid-binding protein